MARGLADGAMRTPKASPQAGKAREEAAYYRARQNSMDDILRKLSELEGVQ